MSFKEWFKSLSYGKKGAFIAGIYSVCSLVIELVILERISDPTFNEYSIFKILAILQWPFFAGSLPSFIFYWFGVLAGSAFLLTVSAFLGNILIRAITVVLIGALIGWVIEKILILYNYLENWRGTHMKKKTILVLCLTFLLLLSASNSILAVASKSEQNTFTLTVSSNDLINLNANEASLKELLVELEKETEIKVNIFDGVDDKKVSLKINALPVYAIHTLLERFEVENFAVVYDKELASKVIYILPEGKDISEVTKGKTIIRPAQFADGKNINQIKSNKIASITWRNDNIPIRYVKNELLLKYYPGVTKEETDEILKKHNLVLIDDKSLLKIGYVKAKIADGREVMEVIKEIRKEYRVKTPEPNFITDILSITDPLYENQWYVQDVDFNKAWDITKNKKPIKIAVVDSGINVKHPDLKDKIIQGYNFLNNSTDISDDNGHGTFVAGIISAVGNDIGIKGLHEYVQIIPVKVIDRYGKGTYEDTAKGIIYAADNGAKVINLSIGGYGYSYMLQDAVDYALEKGCIVVAAGGNDGIEQEIYPAAYPDVIGVSALGYNDQIWSRSNTGRHIDISAPGVDVLSTGLNEDYVYASGTSASASMVTALAAMLVSERPELSSFIIERLIMQSAKDLGDKGRDKVYGLGKIDALASLEQEVEPYHDVAVRSVIIEPPVFEKGKQIYVLVNIENAGTYKSEECDVVFYEIVNGEKKEIAKEEAITVIDKTELIFSWTPRDKNNNVKFEVVVFSKVDSNNSNNSKTTYKFSLEENEGLYILHKVWPPVHQWIAGQAYNLLPSGSMKSEIYNYIGSERTISVDGHSVPGYSESYQIIKGARDEDNGTNWLEHFWDEDAGSNAGGLDLPGLPPYRNAYRRALSYWQDAKNAYNSGNKTGAYYKLGSIAHLLTDMSVPAHTLNDQHACADSYESYMVEWNDDLANRYNYQQWTSSGSPIQQSSLFRQFEYLADTADNYESSDADGEYSSHYEGHNRAWERQITCTGRPYLRYDTSYAEAFNHGNQLMPKVIRYVAGLYEMFWEETDDVRDDDGDGYTENQGDCDDNNSSRFPGNNEKCDGQDNDCNSGTADGSGESWYGDSCDGSDSDLCEEGTYYCSSGNKSCNDTSGNSNEVCNGVDDDCDGLIDEGVKNTYYYDNDQDSYGNPNNSTQACTQPSGYVTNNTDCNDSNASINPGAPEVCDGVDNNCNGQTDEGVKNTYYFDNDHDSYGNPNNLKQACTKPSGYVTNNGDCNDNNASINPGATEVCDGVDNNCNGQTDEGLTNTYYYDNDQDSYGNPNNPTQACTQPSGYVTNDSDCNDNNPSINPGATEVCDGVDNNCNGQTDEGVKNTYYPDNDKDSYGNPNNSTQACTLPSGYATNNGDCNDNDAEINPGATEGPSGDPTCSDEKDNDCDGDIDANDSDCDPSSLNCPDGGSIECLERTDGGNESDNFDSSKPKVDIKYEFRLVVKDSTGSAPQHVRLYMTQRDNPFLADFYNYDMSCSGDYSTGATCTYYTVLGPAAVHKFYFEARMSDDTILTYPETGYITGPEVQLCTDFNLVGLPRDLAGTNLDGSAAFGTEQAYRWTADLGYYTEVSTSEPVEPGEGYFVLKEANTLPEKESYEDIADAEYMYELKAEWNIISSPYAGNVKLSDIQVKKGSGTPVSWTNAVTNEWLVNAIYYYNGSDWGGTYSFETEPDATLVPWMGYWMYLNMTDDTYYLLIPKPAQ